MPIMDNFPDVPYIIAGIKERKHCFFHLHLLAMCRTPGPPNQKAAGLPCKGNKEVGELQLAVATQCG